MSSIIHEIQTDLLSGDGPLSSVLRKARAAAKKLDLAEFEKWIQREADGYEGVEAADVPKYRHIPISPRFFNPAAGWCPIMTEDPQFHDALHSTVLREPIAEIEAMAASGGSYAISYSIPIVRTIRQQMGVDLDIKGHINSTSFQKPINAVKNALLDWAIALEKAGVLGENLSFTKNDHSQAATVTQNIYAQNIGTLGNISGSASVSNKISENTYSIGSIAGHIPAIREAVVALPEEARTAATEKLDELETALSVADEPKAKSALQSIRAICEGAAGNLAASGILGLIASLGA